MTGASSRATRATAPPRPDVVDGYRAGDVIGQKYQLVRPLGEGGMGSIWLAHNLPLDADVALKLIRADAAAPDAAGRLLTEARAAARLRHPSIVRIFDLGQTERNEPFIVMELLEGESLGVVLDRKITLPAENAVQTLLPVIAGLARAHESGVIHRDVKPENIVLSRGEAGTLVPKLVDFGVVKFRDRSPFNPLAGDIEGSPDYMAPEQARGSVDVDERADVWGMSVVMYEVLCGERPFSAPNHRLLLDVIQRDPPSPLPLGEVDPELAKIVLRGLAKQRRERWQSMRELGQALAQWAAGRGIDTDITGASISLAWLDAEPRRPLSDAPPRQTLTSRPSLGGVEAEVEGKAVSLGPSTVSIEPSLPPPPRISDAAAAESDATADVGSMSAARELDGRTAPVWTPPAKERSWSIPIAGGVLVAVGGLSWFLSDRFYVVEAERVAIPANEEAPADPVAATAEAVASASAPPPKPVAPAPPALAVAPDMAECVASYFPPRTFSDSGSTLAGICEERDPRKGAKSLHAEVVRGSSGETTEGMRQWSQLGWYEMALVAAMRARCCPLAEPVWLPAPVGTCPSLAVALDELASAHAGGAEIDEPVDAVRRAVHCTLKSGADFLYAYHEHPQGSAEPLLRHALDQAGATIEPR
jgi:eukaryotic-like serine/threonine-protein kinase